MICKQYLLVIPIHIRKTPVQKYMYIIPTMKIMSWATKVTLKRQKSEYLKKKYLYIQVYEENITDLYRDNYIISLNFTYYFVF